MPSTTQVTTRSDHPIKILFLAANPRDMDPLRLDDEVRSIDQSLRRAALRDQFELIPHWAVRYSDLQELLLRHQPDIVHFSGHGAEGDEIILVNDNGESIKISGRALAMLFSVLKDNVRCVVFNECFSRPEADLVAQTIDVVIGMNRNISDEAAINFSSAFYQGLAYGRSFQTAFELGCVQLSLANLAETDTPQIVALRGDPAQITLARTTIHKPTAAQPSTSKYNITVNNAQGLVIGDSSQVTQNFGTQVNTSGGTYVEGDVNTGGDFVGRDKNDYSVSPVTHETGESNQGLRNLLAQHQRNLLKLQQKKAIYGAGEEPLSLSNQIEHEEQEIAKLKSQIGHS